MFMKATILLGCVLFVYVLLSMIAPLRLRWWWKALLCMPLGAVAFKYQLLYGLWGGHFFRPAVPMWLELATHWLFMSLLMLVVVLLFVDVGALLVWLCVRKRVKGFRSGVNKLHLALLLGVLLCTAWGMYQAFALPRVHEITVQLPHLKQPVRLAMLTDLHADRYKQAPFFREVVERTNALQADAVVITGDFEDGSLRDLGPALHPLSGLRSRWGTFAVHGNHDYFSGHAAWERYLSSLGIRFLNNEWVLPGNGQLVLAGVPDLAAGRDNGTPPNLRKSLAGAPQHKAIVLLCHQPKLAQTAAEYGVDLQLSGHTHGGHAPGVKQLIARFNDGLVQGLYRRGDMQVYVSNGTSLWSGFPLRLFTPAEITLIHLQPQQ